MNKITLTSDIANFTDEVAHEWLSKLQTKVDSINERTKIHTIEIRDIEKLVKELIKKNDILPYPKG